MFIKNKYTRWYFSIVAAAAKEPRIKTQSQYYESHHIIPKSLGGDNTKSNLVLLTAKEHYVCHLLLPKMCGDTVARAKMTHAYLMISTAHPSHTSNNRYTSNLYQTMKCAYIRSISGSNSLLFGRYWSHERRQQHKERLYDLKINTGLIRTKDTREKISKTRKENQLSADTNNPMFGKKHTVESRRKMSDVKKQRIRDRGVENHKQKQILANPRSRPVKTPRGIFPSLSEARRQYGLVSKYSANTRIESGEWCYVTHHNL